MRAARPVGAPLYASHDHSSRESWPVLSPNLGVSECTVGDGAAIGVTVNGARVGFRLQHEADCNVRPSLRCGIFFCVEEQSSGLCNTIPAGDEIDQLSRPPRFEKVRRDRRR